MIADCYENFFLQKFEIKYPFEKVLKITAAV
jgi:hypothetical protein